MTSQEQHDRGNEYQNFSRWETTLPKIPSDTPSTGSVVQVKIKRLVRYPNGKSAMVWYGSGTDPHTVLAPIWEQLSQAYPADTLLWRQKSSNNPALDLKKVMDRFVSRFGCKPKLNESESFPV